MAHGFAGALESLKKGDRHLEDSEPVPVFRGTLNVDWLHSSLAGSGRYPIRGETESAQDVVQSSGRIAADDGAMRWARRGVQGVAFARREEIGEHSPGVRVDDGQLAIEVVA